jgi:hypothetical protein
MTARGTRLAFAALAIAAGLTLSAGRTLAQETPAANQPVTTAPSATEAPAAEPVVTEPAATEAPTEPAVTEAPTEAPTEPGATEPAVTEGAPTDPVTPGPAAAEPPPADEPRAIEVVAPAVDIPVPADPVAKAAFDVLEKHCSRCHQDGKLVSRAKPAKNFGFILMLDKLAADPHYVVPGNPDGSKIVQMILNAEMPYDVNYEFDTSKPEVTEGDLLALRDWITALGATETAACSAREFITPVDEVTAMAADLEKVERTRVADTRYLTHTHLYNACATDEEMKVYRLGAVKLLNSLSRVSDVVRPETADEAGTIIRFNLKDLGWEAHDWDKVLAVYPYGTKPDSQMFNLLAGATYTALPYIRADWFAFTASQPPLYDVLLGLADDFAGLERDLDIDVIRNIDRFVVKRSGFQQSGVSQNNRMIERHSISTGYFWTSYDFAGNRTRQSFFEFPLGPGDGDFAFDHDGGETIFALPNGFQAYYLNTADGKKLDKGPTQIVRDLSRRDLTVTNGISCMGCHEYGIRKAKDEVRAHVTADRTFPKDVREAVEALYPPVEEMDRILEEDLQSFVAAMDRAGLAERDASGNLFLPKFNGIEMINALAKRFENDVELKLAAAEFGQSEEEFLLSLGGAANAEAIHLKRRLEQGLVPRDLFESQFINIVEHVSDLHIVDLGTLVAGTEKVAVAKAIRPVEDRRSFDLALISDKSRYQINEPPVFTVRSEEDCYLTLINVDGHGVATVIFPNKFQQDNLLRADHDLDFPSADANFQFAFTEAATETVIAICSLDDKPVDDITYDFGTDFTALGDYDEVLTRAIKPVAKKPAEPQPTKHGDIVARAAIKVEVH